MSNSKTNMNFGGWSNWNFTINNDAKKVFEEAFKGFTGVEYEAYAVATRATPQNNYAFICEGTPVSPDPAPFLALVNISALSGKAKIENIQVIPPAPHAVPGGYSGWSFPASADAVKALGNADQPIGVEFEPYGSSQQVVSGMNYALFCSSSPVLPEKQYTSNAVVLTVYAPLEGEKPQISAMMDIMPGSVFLETK